MTEDVLSFFSEDDRRSASGFNRFRRFLNNYWLIPLMICYLQLATQVIYPSDSPLQRLEKGNRAFLQGIPIAYEIATRDFPFTLLGHFYELGIRGAYQSGFFQVPHEDIKTALARPELQNALYQRLLVSRDHHDSEVGGLLSISYAASGEPNLNIYPISSLNEIYLARLRKSIETPESLIGLLEADYSHEILDGVGIREPWIESTRTLIQSDRISEPLRQTMMQNFLEMYEALSESRYILSPYQFKAGLGRIPLDERFVGIFHFHNGLNEPPSAVDIQQSQRNRQLVFTFSESGWTLYDVNQEVLAMVDIKIDNRLHLQ